MKNLYLRIGLTGRTDDTELLRQAIARSECSDPAASLAASKILLDPKRKPVYDRTFVVLVKVGELRKSLGLSRAANWLVSDCTDFSTAPATTQASANPESESDDEHGISTATYVKLAVGATVFCLCIVPVWLQRKSPNPARDSAHVVTDQPLHIPQPPPIAVPNSAPLVSSPQQSPTQQPVIDPAIERQKKARSLVSRRFARERVAASEDDIEAAALRLTNRDTEPPPPTGVLQRYHTTEAVAPLEIQTAVGRDYYVKLVDWSSKSVVVTGFIHGGEKFDILVPVGRYELRYAAGKEWLGPVLDFGEAATYAKCEEQFDFVESEDGYNGYTIELILQRNGNLETEMIDEGQF